VGLEGYINAKVLVEGLRRAGRNLDRERFINAIESIRDYSLGIANTLSFSPNDHQGFDRVYFTRFKEGKFVLIADWKEVKESLARRRDSGACAESPAPAPGEAPGEAGAPQ